MKNEAFVNLMCKDDWRRDRREGEAQDMNDRVIGDPLLARQDYVDNAVFLLILELAPAEARDGIPWDIEMIGEVRDAVQKCICEKLGLMSPEEFYP